MIHGHDHDRQTGGNRWVANHTPARTHTQMQGGHFQDQQASLALHSRGALLHQRSGFHRVGVGMTLTTN